MTALIKEDTTAIKTASASAQKTKLKPKGRIRVEIKVFPLKTKGNRDRETARGKRTSNNASMFLTGLENFPVNGNIKAPIKGARTADSIM
jgi:hypothetical protein